MEINWYGHSCFRLSGRGTATVVCDPYDSEEVGYEPLKLKADIVTISHESPSHNDQKAVRGDAYIIDGPGEYEVGGVFVTGLQTDKRKKNGKEHPVNTLYLIDYYGINIVHLGDITQVPTQSEVESLGPVHIALVPVGGGGALDATRASEVISLFEPNIVIPMHYATAASKADLEPIGKFLKVMGLSEVDTLPVLNVTDPEKLPEETEVVILDFSH